MIEIDMRIIFAEYGLSVLLCLIVIVSLGLIPKNGV